MPAEPALALWGSADLPGLGDQLFARIFDTELAARLPGWRIGHLAPAGWDRPLCTDGGLVVEPLGDYHDQRLTRVGQEYRLSVYNPAFPLGSALSYGPSSASRFYSAGLRQHALLAPAVRVTDPVPSELAGLLRTQPLVSTRDARSAELLAEHGVSANVVPHPGLLAEHLVDSAVLAQRQAALRQLGVLPEEGAYLVVQLAGALLPDLDRMATAANHTAKRLGVEHIVLLPDGRTTAPPPGWYPAPAELVLEDRLAIIAGARAALPTDEHGAAVATAFGVDWAFCDVTGTQTAAVREFGAPEQFAASLAELPTVFSRHAEPVWLASAVGSLAAEFDAIAGHAESRDNGTERRNAALAAENAALRAAHDRLRQRLHAERQTLVEQLVESGGGGSRELRAELELERELHGALADRHNATVAELAECRAELEALRNTKLYRWTTPLRGIYGRLGR
ncbi:hypothetical protein [Tamaricihabitans halophyticus]|uniref:hypothetical protein n=1 Tax=Tamaricihabitans halophyticus TaxID=1262583 RepID=UPI001051C105|nr:hypothetical protein [Tamaricihabitans halophyticus]